MNEADLVRRSQVGDEEAFCVLVEQHRNVLFGTAYLMTRDRGLADDAVQEALFKMWKNLPSFRFQGSFKAWLVRIVANEVKQQYRKKQVPTTPIKEAAEIGGNHDEAEERALLSEERRRMGKALSTLPEEQREVVVLRYFADLTVPEIAKTMGCKDGTVKSRLNRALGRLAHVLGDQNHSGLGQEA